MPLRSRDATDTGLPLGQADPAKIDQGKTRVRHAEQEAPILAKLSRREFLGALATAQVFATTTGAKTMPKDLPKTAGTPGRGSFIVFDVNETLLDFTVLAPVFSRIFGDATMLRDWFNQVILYSEALTLADEYVDSGIVGVAVLEMLAAIKDRTVQPADLDELKRLSSTMPTYPDTSAALARLREAGFRLVTLSNNPSAAVDRQLAAAGLRTHFEQLHSIDDAVRRYKPARESYTALAATLGVPSSDLWLVSCHAFDTLGAAAAGYRTALVLRPENAPVALGRPPDIVAKDLGEIAAAIVKAGTRP